MELRRYPVMAFSRLHISVFLGVAVLAWAAVLYSQGVRLSWEEVRVHLAPFSTVVGALVTLALVLEHLAWPLPVLHGWLVKRPDVRGTWRVQLQSDWIDPQTQQRIPPITCYMGVKQTLSTLQMHLMTPESESWFIADQIRPSPSGEGYQVVGVYTNRPDVHLRGVRSEIHRGVLVFDTHGPPSRPESLTGEYWTDRKTSGTMALESRLKKVFTQFADAAREFSPAAAKPAAKEGP
jgi:hypothetical protein